LDKFKRAFDIYDTITLVFSYLLLSYVL